MTIEQDITGQRFGSLTAIRKDTTSKKVNRWVFRCDCGTEKSINKYSVLRGLTTSCGCYAKEQRTKAITKHNLWKHPLFGKWSDIKNRCYNPNRERYKIYGARGIVMCEEWKNDFKAFYDWAISSGWKPELSIDRIDVNGNYCPENCRWITMKEQAQNKRNTVFIEYKGIKKCIAEWARVLNISESTLTYRIKNGWNIDKAFNYQEV